MYNISHIEEICNNGIDARFKYAYVQRNWEKKVANRQFNIVVENPLCFDKAKDSITTDEIIRMLKQNSDYKFSTKLITTTRKEDAQSILFNRRSLYDEIHFGRSREEMKTELQHADILIKASRIEGVPGTQLEMMGTGGIVVTTNVKGIEEYATDKKNCLMFKFGNTHQAYRLINDVCDDSEQCNYLSCNSRVTAENTKSSEEAGEVFAAIVESRNWEWSEQDREKVYKYGRNYFNL